MLFARSRSRTGRTWPAGYSLAGRVPHSAISRTTASGVAARLIRTAAVAQHDHLIYGYSAGLGVDMMLYHGLFARAEWEYVRFTTSVDTTVNTVRVGLGYKF